MTKEEKLDYSIKRQALSIPTETELYKQYPPVSKRKETFLSLYDAAKENSLALSVVDKTMGNGVALRWVKIQLIEVLSFFGAFENCSEFQIVTLARHIRNKYYYLTLAELSYFFEAFEDGTYGTFYVGKSVNPQNIMEAIKKFEDDVILQRERVYNEKLNKERERQNKIDKEKEKQGLIGIQAWYRYCEKTHRENTKLPGLSLKCKNDNHENRN